MRQYPLVCSPARQRFDFLGAESPLLDQNIIHEPQQLLGSRVAGLVAVVDEPARLIFTDPHIGSQMDAGK